MRFLLFVLFLLGAVGPVYAQQATVRGSVADGQTGLPLPTATVVLTDADGLRRGTAADADGRFAFSGLRPGRFALRASFVGYADTTVTLDLAFGALVTIALPLRPVAAALAGVAVEAEGARPATAPTPTPAGLTTIRPATLTLLPSPSPSADLAAVLLAQPGVAALGDRGGELYVRGGEPTQNLVLLDGMRVFQPFHLVGFYSVIPADFVAYADVYAGGFGARYGGRLSSVIDVQTRNGDKRRFQGAASVAPFLGALRLEGPLLPGQLSFIGSLRQSVIERIAPTVLGLDLPYRFGDAYGKLHAQLDPRTTLAVTALRSFDEGTLDTSTGDTARVDWRNAAAGARFYHINAHQPVAIDLGVFSSRYRSAFGEAAAPSRTADVRNYGGHFILAYLLGPQQVRLGIAAQTLLMAYDFDAASAVQTEENVSDAAFFVEGDFSPGRGVRVEPGLRLQVFPGQQQPSSWEPRLRLAWEAAEGHTVSAALGLYRQEVTGLTDQRDIGDVFTAWAKTRPQNGTPEAIHVIFGYGWQLRAGVEVGVEGYAKRLRNLSLVTEPGTLRRTDGDVWGLDARLSAGRGPVSVLASYGLSSVRYDDGAIRYRPPHDRRHRLLVGGRLQRGGWALRGQWQYASGRPFTRVLARRSGPPPIVFFEDPPYQGLTPAYHRLDLTLEWRQRLRDRATLALQAGLVNAYDRDNLFFYDAERLRRIDQLPLLPTVGLEVTF